MQKNSWAAVLFVAFLVPTRTFADEIAIAPPAALPPSTAEAIASALIAACPSASPSDEAARQKCAHDLGGNPVLDAAMDEPFLWGGQAKAGNYDLTASHLTRFNPFVWRRMYLSLFMFAGGPRIEEQGTTTIVHLLGSFRNELQPGSYPYPFWHSDKKWNSYQASTELLLIISDGKLRGAMRAATFDDTRPKVARTFDGHWTWADGKEPRNTLFRSLLSTTNPHVARLDASYRRLEGVMRAHGCQSCHSPNNSMGMNPLELLAYPNQALAARHRLVEQIEQNKMPPEHDGGNAGIARATDRRKALDTARAFERAADAALEYERRKNQRVAGNTGTKRP